MDRIAIVDYDAGNLHSIASAVRSLGADVTIVADGSKLEEFDRVVLPGVGAFGDSMSQLRERGLIEAINLHIAQGLPFLGICVGFQVLFARGTELGTFDGLGQFSGSVDVFETQLHVPHVGWNVLHQTSRHPLWSGIRDGAHVYFVHSYRPTGVDPAVLIGESEYDGRFTCAVARGSTAGLQFHPEKSGRVGLRILHNFLNWNPGAE